MHNLNSLDIYFIVINILGFIIFSINALLYKFTLYDIDDAVTVLSVLGGSPGIFLAILILGQKVNKELMMSRVFAFCLSIIQIIIFIMLKMHFSELSLAIWNIFIKYKLFLIYIGIINLITFTIFAIDKINSLQGKWRYSIISLLTLCVIGGSIGGLAGMYIFRHKTQQSYFVYGIPLIIIMQIVVLFFIYNLVNGNISF